MKRACLPLTPCLWGAIVQGRGDQGGGEKSSEESNVGDDHTPYLLIQLLQQLRPHHAQVLSQGRIGNLHEERLIPNKLLTGIFCYGFSCHQLPRIHESLLMERRFQSPVAEQLVDDGR